jgi:O-antigen/teichoic acid export membrane protein
VLAFVPAALIVWYGREVIELWTRMPDVALTAAPVAAILIVGNSLNAVMTPPYALQLANGSTRIGFWVTLVQFLTYGVLVYILGTRYGVVAAASAWPLIHIGYIVVAIPLTHRWFLKGESAAQWVRDVSVPAIVAFSLAGVLTLLHNGELSRAASFAIIAVIGLTVMFAAGIAAPAVRAAVTERVSKRGIRWR